MTELVVNSTASGAPETKPASFWRHPSAWIRDAKLSRQYWTFFTAAFFLDAGFSVYVFLFNLYLLDCRMNERVMGWVGGALTLGSMLGTLPAGALARKIGLRPLLIAVFLSAPLLNAARVLWIWEPAQVGLAFLAGVSLSSWGVCFLSAIARLTTPKNRAAGFSVIFSVSVGVAVAGGVVCGYLRQWLASAGLPLQPVAVKRLILLGACTFVVIGLIPTLRLRMQPNASDGESSSEQPAHWLRMWKLSSFLIRFLPAMALWSAVLQSFTPFANVYLTRNLHVPMEEIGIVFSTAQILQFSLGLFTPILFRAVGLVNGIAATQMVAAALLAVLAAATNGNVAIVLYLAFSAAQWMSAPGLYNLLMNETPDAERSNAAALTLFFNALAGSAATAGTGVLLTRFGYPPVLAWIAAAAVAITLLFFVLMRRVKRRAITD